MNALAHTLMQIRGELHIAVNGLGRRYSTAEAINSNVTANANLARMKKREAMLAAVAGHLPDEFTRHGVAAALRLANEKRDPGYIAHELVRNGNALLQTPHGGGAPAVYRKTAVPHPSARKLAEAA